MPTKVVILCGGMGTRLKEETEIKPKPMVTIGNKPILWHIMKIYAHYGFKDFVLCLGYKGEVIKEYFLNYDVLNSDFTIKLGQKKTVAVHNTADESEWTVTLADTGSSALKGARLKKIEKYIKEDTFMVTYGDGVGNIDIKKLLAFHKSHGKLATVTGVRPPSLFGELQVKNNKAIIFAEKPQTSTGLINGGFFVFNRKLFDYLTDDDSCDFEKGPLEKIAAKGELMVYTHDGAWACMDTIRDVEYLNKLWQTNEAFWKVWR
ncbi:MAG: glucose-1-phosphate cytidylyltransferase [Dehalococcoidales bacterium]